MQEAVIVSGARTPVGAFGGSLKSVSAIELGAVAIREAVKRAGLRPLVSEEQKAVGPDKLKGQGDIALERKSDPWDPNATPCVFDEVIMGNVLLAGQGQNPARQAMIRAGIPKETPAFTINKVCASGLKAIALGADGVIIGTMEMVALGCVRCGRCSAGRGCPRCIATTDKKLVRKIDLEWGTQRLINLYNAWRNEILRILQRLGIASVAGLRGRSDLLMHLDYTNDVEHTA